MNPCIVVSYYFDGIAGIRLAGNIHGKDNLLKNIPENGIPSVWRDGRVHGFAKINSSDLSTDGFTEKLKEMPNTHVLEAGLTKPQSQKQKFDAFEYALSLGFDTMIMLGCDEYLTGDWNLFCRNLEKRLQYNMPRKYFMNLDNRAIQEKWNNYTNQIGRIYVRADLMYRNYCHYGWCWDNKGEEHMVITEEKPVNGVTIVHDDSIRPDWRNELMDKYQEKVVPYEQAHMNKLLAKYNQILSKSA